MPRIAYRSRWIFPVSAPPIENGIVETQAGRIVDVRAAHRGEPAIDLGEVALLPALVNAHTHLEFSSLERPLGRPGIGFADWIAEVVAWKRRSPVEGSSLAKRLSIAAGSSESWRFGVGAVGEIATEPWEPDVYDHPMLSCVLFHELLGLAPERAAAAWERFSEIAESDASLRPSIDEVPADGSSASVTTAPLHELGVSPHAPYTVGLEQTKRGVEWAASRRRPLAMHVAESIDERELMTEGTGPLRELLERVGAWVPQAFGRRDGWRALLTLLSGAPRVALVHANFLSPDEFDLVATHRDRFTIVHCPRTHAFFGHARHPVDQALQRGIPLALGTDSRASNPDLSIWREARHAAMRHPQHAAHGWIDSITTTAAAAIGVADRFGSLAAGRSWLPCVIELPRDAPDRPNAEFLLQESTAEPRPLIEPPSGMPRFA